MAIDDSPRADFKKSFSFTPYWQTKAWQDAQAKAEDDKNDETAKKNAEAQKNKGAKHLALGAVKGVGGFVKDMALDLKDTAVDTYQGAGDMARAQLATKDLAAKTDAAEKMRKEYQVKFGNATEKDWSNPEFKKKAQEFQAAIKKVNTPSERSTEDIAIGQKVDRKKLAADSAETFLNVATLGTGTAAKQVVKTGAKSALKAGARAAGEGAVFGAATGAIDATEDGNLNDIGSKTLQGAAFGGILGGVAGTAGGVMGSKAKVKADKKLAIQEAKDVALQEAKVAENAKLNTPVDDSVNKLSQELDDTARMEALAKEADDKYISGRQEEYNTAIRERDFQNSQSPIDETKLLPETSSAPLADDISGELNSLNDGSHPLAQAQDFEGAAKRKADLLAQQEQRKIQDSQKNIQEDTFHTKDSETNIGATVEDINVQQKNIDDGNIPQELQQDHPVVNNLADVRFSKALPPELTSASDQVLRDQAIVRSKMDTLMTQDNYDLEMKNLDEWHLSEETRIAEMPAPRQEVELARLNDEYSSKMDEFSQKLETDKAEAEHYTKISDHLDSKESQLLQDTNAMMIDQPELFKVPDEAKLAVHQEKLKAQAELAAKTENTSPQNAPLVGSVENGVKPSESKNPLVKESIEKSEIANGDVYSGGGKNPGIVSQWLGTPREVLSKFGDAGKKIADILSTSIDRVSIADHTISTKIYNWSKQAGGHSGFTQIAKALDGDGAVFSSLNPDQKIVFNQVRDMFKDYADKLGLPENARISEYLPHMFDGKSIDKVDSAIMQLAAGKNIDGKVLTQKEITTLNKIIKGIDYEALAMMKKNSMYTIKNGFLEKRTGADNYSFNLADIISTYAHSAHNTIHLKPAYSTIKELSENLSDQQNIYLGETISAIGGKPSDELGSMLNNTLEGLLGKENYAYNQHSATARKLIYDSTMGANPGSAVKNLSQGANTYAFLGEKYYGKGVADAARSFKKSNGMYDELVNAGVMHNKFSDLLRNGEPGTAKNKFEEALWSMFTRVEQFNRATAYFGEKSRFMDNNSVALKAAGKTDEEIAQLASRAGREMSRKTQFEFSALDIPLKQQGATAKNVLQFQSYNLAQVKMMGRMIKGAEDSMFVKKPNGKYTMTLDGSAKVGRLIGANMLFIGSIGSVIGMKPTDMLPYYNEAKDGTVPKSPIIKLLAGDNGSAGLLTLGNDVRNTVVSGGKDAGKILDDTKEFAGTAATLATPGGSQIKKTVQGLTSTQGDGINTNAKGKIKYVQDTDTTSKINAAIFGQYSTESGKNWIKEGFPTLSDSQTKKVNEKGDDETKKQYIDFYQSLKKAPNRNDALDAMKEAAKSGNSNNAKRLAKEHNDAVGEALRDYYKEHKDTNEEMKKYLNSYGYIKDVQARIDEAKKK